MSLILCKPENIQFTKKSAFFEMIFEEPYYIGVAYSDGKQIQIKKFKGNQMEKGWDELEKLTDYPLIAFVGNQCNKIVEKNIDNLCPIILGDSAYVAAGEILGLRKKTRKQFTDVFYFKQFAFDEMEKTNPSIFFSYGGRWLLHRVVPSKSAMAFLNIKGNYSIINPYSGFYFEKMWYFDTDCVKKDR